MVEAKYYRLVDEARSAWRAKPDPAERFDLTALAPKGFISRISGSLLGKAIGPFYAFARRFVPIVQMAGFYHIARDAEVRDILLRPQDFEVPFGPEMEELGDGATFLLGLEGPEHDRYHAILRQVLRRSDEAEIGAMARRFSAALLDNSDGRIDVVNDLFKRVPAEVCLRYFGLTCDDVDTFADWTLAISAFLFGNPYANHATRQQAMIARDRLSAVIDDAIRRNRAALKTNPCTFEDAETIVQRLILARDPEPLSHREIRAILIGLISGFVPTNTLGGSNMFLALFNRPDAMAMAHKAACADDRETMRKIVLEAGRLNPALAPGQWRFAPRDATLSMGGKDIVIPGGSTLLVSTMSAMRDPQVWENPGKFRIDRTNAEGNWQEPDLIFGVGAHACMGKGVAIAQIGGVFAELFKRASIQPAPGKAGKLQTLGPFPRHLEITYGCPSARQSMFMVIAPVNDSASQAEVDATIAAISKNDFAAIRGALDTTGIVHFCSLSTLESERGVDIVFELNCDGAPEEAIAAIVEHAGPLLEPVFRHANWDQTSSLEAFLKQHVITHHGKMWGATGLTFNGLPEFPVARTERETDYAEFCGRALRDFVASEASRGGHPMLALRHVRRIVRQDPVFRTQATPRQRALMDEARDKGFDAFSLVTRPMRLDLARFREPASHTEAMLNFLRSRDGRVIVWPLAGFYALVGILTLIGFGHLTVGKVLTTLVIAIVGTLLFAAVVLGVLFGTIRWLERREKPSEAEASLDHLASLRDAENRPGYAQNHVFATAMLKPGSLRVFLHAFALWGIRIAITYWFRPGFVLSMGTIHYARWWRLPGTRRVAFFSNFDGSWENYLEDFITRARWGQSAAWSNWEGFPRTRYLIYDGAGDGDAFKRYTRTVQRVAPFWYSRFPELTSDQIRTNGQIRIGAGLASNSTEAEEWLRSFGSMPRCENEVETDEVQAIVLRGMKRLPYSVCLPIHLPPPGEPLGEWLCWITGRPMRIDNFLPGGKASEVEALIGERVLDRVPRPEGQGEEFALTYPLTIAFGDRPLMGSKAGETDTARIGMGQCAFLALSAGGMAKFHHPECKDGGPLAQMASAFRMGMARRGGILGDSDADRQGWRWHDDPAGESPTEAVLMLYASSTQALDRMTTIHLALLKNHGGNSSGKPIRCAPVSDDPDKIDFEHFGFRDGISQPVMRGVGRAMRNVAPRDVIEPGEFILGYPNQSGYLPLSPRLPAEADVCGALPAPGAWDPSLFTNFGADEGPALRDFGRNGTYMVIRELAQDVTGFDQFAFDAAKRLNEGASSELYKLVGQQPDAEWIKAKMMGRWKDGRPLIGNPVHGDVEPSSDPKQRENDFSYADDDPQGLACPFGAHIRRTNPRDSKRPDDPGEQGITNRHRLLRRGRPYADKETGEKGLLFAAVCTDIERQFELVQQFWANAPAFHGLDNEPDPIVGADSADTWTLKPRQRGFSIPTASGPIRLEGLQRFVEARGGGYFFLPSRSALSWLTETALYCPGPAAQREATP